MTVAELIDKLMQLDGRLPVLTPGFGESELSNIDVRVQPVMEYRRSPTSPYSYVDLYVEGLAGALGKPFGAVIIDYD